MTVNNIYTNADGLSIRFGTESARTVPVGSPAQAGSKQQIQAIISFDRMEAFGTATLLDPLFQCAMPEGSIITTANLVVITAFTGAGATLDIGVCTAAGVAIDADGIDATIALTAIDAVGETVTCDGALVAGAALTGDGYLTAQLGTANFTAGKGLLTVNYIVPANH